MNICKKCREEYLLNDGCEPTPYCDACAHEVLAELEAAVKEWREARQEWMSGNDVPGRYNAAAKALCTLAERKP